MEAESASPKDNDTAYHAPLMSKVASSNLAEFSTRFLPELLDKSSHVIRRVRTRLLDDLAGEADQSALQMNKGVIGRMRRFPRLDLFLSEFS
jgi:lysyl-tRNA synthetase class II